MKVLHVITGLSASGAENALYNLLQGGLAALLARFRANGRPALAWNVRHSLYDLAYEKPMMRQVIRTNRWLSPAPQAVLYNSRLSRKQHRAFGFSSRNARIIPNGVNLRRFAYSPEAGRRIGKATQIDAVGDNARISGRKTEGPVLFAGKPTVVENSLRCG